MKQLDERKNIYSPTNLLLKKQNTECEATVINMLDQITSIEKNIGECKKEIKTTERMTKIYEQQYRKCKFYKKCLEKGRSDEIMKELKKECSSCFEEMQPPIKIFQCSQEHLHYENCFKEVNESRKTCPFCKRDLASNPIRNRALEEAIENEARRDMGSKSRNIIVCSMLSQFFCM